MAKAAGGLKAAAGSRTALTMARLGYGARGLIYLLVGGFALAAVLGVGGRAHGITDAVAAIDDTPTRVAVSLLLGLGLACFAGHLTITGLWDWAAMRGPRHWLVAAGMLGDAAIYAGFVVSVLSAAITGHGGANGTHGWTAWLMQQPFGRVLVGIVGIVVLACGVGLILWSAAKDFDHDLSLPRYETRVVRPVARYGLAGRGIAIGLVGVYWLLAAIRGDPSQAHALGGALDTLRQQGLGWVLLLLLGLAFVASAAFDLLEAGFRRREPV